MLAHVFMLAAWAAMAAPIPLAASVHGSLERTLSRLEPTHGAALAAQAARLLRWRGDVARNLHPNDRLSLLYQPAAGPDDQPELLALRYNGRQIRLAAYHYFASPDAPPRFYDADGITVAPVLKSSPVQAYIQITEGLQRGRGKRRHDGIDLKADEGQPVRLPWAATVRRVNWNTRVNGLCVEVTYARSGRRALFLHLASVADGVRPGANLPAGAQVGTVGNTGRSSAAHLHYEIRRRNNRPIDPLKVHGTTQHRLQGAQLADFQGVRHHYDRLMRRRSLAGTAEGSGG